MFVLEIDFHDGVSPPEMLLVRRPHAVIGTSEFAHVVIDGAASSLCELRLTRSLGRQFHCQPINRSGRLNSISPFLEGVYSNEAQLNLGQVTTHIIALDQDLVINLNESPDAAGIRILRQALIMPSPVFPAIATVGPVPIFVSFSADQTVMVGRSRKCALRLDSSEVSAEHARIGFDGSHFWIEDLSSKNGTFVGGQRITGFRVLTADETIGIASDFVIGTILNTEDIAKLSKRVKELPQMTYGPQSYPCIISTAENIRPLRYLLEPNKSVKLGRDPASNIWIGASHISRSHLEILFTDNGKIELLDLSTNGVLIKGQRLPEQKRVEYELQNLILDLCEGVNLAICCNEEDEQNFKMRENSPRAEVLLSPQIDTKSALVPHSNTIGLSQVPYAETKITKIKNIVVKETKEKASTKDNLSVFERMAKRQDNQLAKNNVKSTKASQNDQDKNYKKEEINEELKDLPILSKTGRVFIVISFLILFLLMLLFIVWIFGEV